MSAKQLSLAMAKIRWDVLVNNAPGTAFFLTLSILVSSLRLFDLLPPEIHVEGIPILASVLLLFPLDMCRMNLESRPLTDKHLEILANAGVQEGLEGEHLKQKLRIDGKLHYEDLKQALKRMQAKPEPTIGKQRFLKTAV